jgi:multicomponent Na+:H+ antiporter subunit A
MLGLVLADNLITLYVFWELTTLASYLLIGCERALAGSTQRRSAPGGALLVPRCSALLIPGARPEGAPTRPASGAAHWPAASRSPG